MKELRRNEIKTLKCSRCPKIVEVGSKCTLVICEDCTEKDYQRWVKERSKQKEEVKKEEIEEDEKPKIKGKKKKSKKAKNK